MSKGVDRAMVSSGCILRRLASVLIIVPIVATAWIAGDALAQDEMKNGQAGQNDENERCKRLQATLVEDALINPREISDCGCRQGNGMSEVWCEYQPGLLAQDYYNPPGPGERLDREPPERVVIKRLYSVDAAGRDKLEGETKSRQSNGLRYFSDVSTWGLKQEEFGTEGEKDGPYYGSAKREGNMFTNRDFPKSTLTVEETANLELENRPPQLRGCAATLTRQLEVKRFYAYARYEDIWDNGKRPAQLEGIDVVWHERVEICETPLFDGKVDLILSCSLTGVIRCDFSGNEPEPKVTFIVQSGGELMSTELKGDTSGQLFEWFKAHKDLFTQSLDLRPPDTRKDSLLAIKPQDEALSVFPPKITVDDKLRKDGKVASMGYSGLQSWDKDMRAVLQGGVPQICFGALCNRNP